LPDWNRLEQTVSAGSAFSISTGVSWSPFVSSPCKTGVGARKREYQCSSQTGVRLGAELILARIVGDSVRQVAWFVALPARGQLSRGGARQIKIVWLRGTAGQPAQAIHLLRVAAASFPLLFR
jgi:hypothetical protein